MGAFPRFRVASGEPLRDIRRVFGGERVITASSGNAYKFTGNERDSESSLDNFEARFIFSALGRFMSPDPSGISLADPTDPQQLNLYVYVRDNPLANIDPFGLDCIYLNAPGDKVIEVIANDCKDDSDSGYFVDGTILNGTSGVTLTSDNNYATFFLQDSDNPVSGTAAIKCLNDCPSGQSVTVFGSPDFPVQDLATVAWNNQLHYRPSNTFLERLGDAVGCGTGLALDYSGAMFADSRDSNTNPSDSTKETDGNKRAQPISRTDAQPAKYKNGKPIDLNRAARGGGDKASGVANALQAASDVVSCLGKSRTPQ